MTGAIDRRSSFFFQDKTRRREGGLFIVSVFAEVARGQLPQPVIMFPCKGCGRDAERNEERGSKKALAKVQCCVRFGRGKIPKVKERNQAGFPDAGA